MTKLQKILMFLEERLDEDHIRDIKQRAMDIMNYKDAGRISLKVGYPQTSLEIEPYTYSEAFESMEKMMANELLACIAAVEVKDDTVPMIRANYGVGILPSLFGMNCRIVNDSMPWVDHAGSPDEIKRIIDKDVPDFRMGLGGRVLDTHEYYMEQLSHYPKCSALIPIYHADLQGPFDVAHLIWGPDIYYAIYDYPDLVHNLLELIVQTYIGFMKEMKKTIRDVDDGYVYHWRSLYLGDVVLRDDTPVNLSRDAYEEFVRPYDQQILDAFGGGSMHYCGRADQWIFSMMECRGLKALNFGQPPKLIFGFEFLDKIYDQAKERDIAIIDYIMGKNQVKGILQSRFTTGVTYTTSVTDKEEAETLLKEL